MRLRIGEAPAIETAEIDMAVPVRKGYSTLQIGLHWVIALLIAVQILYHEPMVGA